MGLLRMMLALSVLTAHSHGRGIFGFRLLYGNLAVQCFFMISGFYMALVLNEKYNRTRDYIPFIGQRLLRLFPAYFAVLLLVLVVEGVLSLAAGKAYGGYVPWATHAAILSPRTWITLICSNLFIIGQGINLFQAIDPVTGNLYYTGRFNLDPIPATTFTFVGQAWTLSLEFMFYVIAPLLVRRATWIQVLIVMASVALRMGTSWMIDPYEHPWHMDHFFPYELAFFMAGSVGYQIYRHQQALIERLAGFMKWFRWIFFLIVMYYSRLPGTSYMRESFFIPLLFVMIPVLFYFTKNNKTDRLIGELSYPLYLVHALIISTVRFSLIRYIPEFWVGPIYAFLAIGIAYVIFRRIDEKVDDFRHQLFARRRAQAARPDLIPAG